MEIDVRTAIDYRCFLEVCLVSMRGRRHPRRLTEITLADTGLAVLYPLLLLLLFHQSCGRAPHRTMGVSC